MNITPSGCEAFVISGVDGLDPVTVFLQDFGRDTDNEGRYARGRLIVECWGEAWSCYWGAMAAPDIQTFLARTSPCYLVDKLWPSYVYRSRRMRHREQYLERIVEAVIAACKERGLQ